MFIRALGWSLKAILRLMVLNIISTLITFMPPAVEEEEPPTKNRQSSSIRQNEGHTEKSVVVKPVVDMIDPTWKKAWCIAERGVFALPEMYRHRDSATENAVIIII